MAIALLTSCRSGQLSSLGSRLSRIETLLPSLKQTPPSLHSSTSGESDETVLRLNNIERRIDGFDSKLETIQSMLANLTNIAGRPTTAADATGQRRFSDSERTAGESVEEELAQEDSLVSDGSGNIHYLGRSSTYGFRADAELLIQSRLKGSDLDSAQFSSSDINTMSSNQGGSLSAEEWQTKAAMTDHLSDLAVGAESVGNRERSVPPGGDSQWCSTSNTKDIRGICCVSNTDFYLPTPEEQELILDREYPFLVAYPSPVRSL